MIGAKLMPCDSLAINTMVKKEGGKVASCGTRFTDDLDRFSQDDMTDTAQVAKSGEDRDLSEDSNRKRFCIIMKCSFYIKKKRTKVILRIELMRYNRYNIQCKKISINKGAVSKCKCYSKTEEIRS